MIKSKSLTVKVMLAALAAIFAFSCAMVVGMTDKAVAQENDYEVVYNADGTTVKGVNLKQSTGGILTYAIDKETAPTYSSQTGFSGAYALITYELGEISVSDYSMLLIKIDRTVGTENAAARFFVETSDGNFYRFNTGSARNDALINEDGTAGTLENNKSVYYKMAAGKLGTLSVPMTLPIATGTVVPGSGGTAAAASSNIPAEAKIVRFHVGLDTRSNGWYGLTREFGIGSIGALKAADNTVTTFLDSTKLTYTTDATATADVNLADMTKGAKVYTRHTISGSWVVDENAEYIARVNAVPTFKRAGYKVICEYKDASGNSVSPAQKVNSVYDAQTATFAYEVTAPEIAGYTYKQADKALNGTLTSDITVTFTYEEIPVPKMTLTFVNENGNEIRAQEQVKSVFNGTDYDYQIEAPEIFGYEFKQADKELVGKITEDSAMTLTYTAQSLMDSSEYEVIRGANGAFVGVNLKASTSGALAINVTAIDSSTGYSLVTFDVGEVKPDISTGLLLQVESLGTANLTQVRLYVEATDGTLYRLTGTPGCTDPVLITPDGQISSVTNSESNARYQFNAETDGTIFIPWSAASVANSSTFQGIEEGTVLTKFYFGRELRYSSTLNGKVAVGVIAEVNVKEDEVQIKELINTAELTYSATAGNGECQVNIADKKSGSTVYMNKWATGVNQFGEEEALDKTVALVELSRVPHDVTVKYVDKAGNPVKEDGKAQTGYQDGVTAYVITPAIITGYDYVSADAALEGTTSQNLTVTLTYERIDLQVTVKYVNEEGDSVKEDDLIGVTYDGELEAYKYVLIAPDVWGYIYKEADAALEGTITESITVTMVYTVDTGLYQNYDAIFDDGTFVGVNIKDSMSGAISMNVNGQTSTNDGDVYGYSVITVDIGNVDPSQSTGILIKTKRIDNKNTMAQVRMFLEDSNGVLYRLFSRPGDVTGEKSSSVLITPEGEISSVTNDSANHRHLFYGNTNGTIFIPWTDVATVANELLPEGVVFTKFHFGREGRYGSALERPVALSHVAVVKVDGVSVGVKMLADLTKMTYTVDASDTTADVNLADMTKGKRVTFGYVTGVNEKGTDAEILQEQLSIVEIERLPATIILKFVNEEGDTIKGDAIASATYQDGASVYDITPVSIVGYQFLSADKGLTGSTQVDFVLTLTYTSIDYVITLEFVNEAGEAIGQSRTLTGKFGEYVEITADEIEGYTYKEATSGLKFTITGEKTIRLIYKAEEVGSNCQSSSSVSAGGAGIIGLVAAAITVIMKKREG